MITVDRVREEHLFNGYRQRQRIAQVAIDFSSTRQVEHHWETRLLTNHVLVATEVAHRHTQTCGMEARVKERTKIYVIRGIRLQIQVFLNPAQITTHTQLIRHLLGNGQTNSHVACCGHASRATGLRGRGLFKFICGKIRKVDCKGRHIRLGTNGKRAH